jgi:hypothetical protein
MEGEEGESDGEEGCCGSGRQLQWVVLKRMKGCKTDYILGDVLHGRGGASTGGNGTCATLPVVAGKLVENEGTM